MCLIITNSQTKNKTKQHFNFVMQTPIVHDSDVSVNVMTLTSKQKQ